MKTSTVAFEWGGPNPFTAATTKQLVTLAQSGPDNFTVTYGLQVAKHLNYAEAARELGECIMHALACNSLLDNRTKAEARKDARTR